jgi:hypothetical protein
MFGIYRKQIETDHIRIKNHTGTTSQEKWRLFCAAIPRSKLWIA